MDEARPERVVDLGEAPGLRQRDQFPPPLLRGLRVRARVRVEEREARHALRRLPHHGERDVSTHRQPGQGEALGRVCEKPRRDGVDSLVGGVVRDGDHAVGPENLDLWREQRSCAVQARHEHKRSALHASSARRDSV
jgi:hypothetical protein